MIYNVFRLALWTGCALLWAVCAWLLVAANPPQAMVVISVVAFTYYMSSRPEKQN
ncbi:MAG: hypothetical protein Q4A11_04265 [Brachymonas sp.]|nr:hypothetical protein [Brachymonas sp.]